MAKTKKVKQEELAEQPRGYSSPVQVDNPEELVLQVLADMLLAEASKQEWVAERNRDVKAYFGIKNVKDWPFKGAAKISSGFHRITCDTLCGNIIKSIFSPEDTIQVRPTNVNSMESARYVSDLMNHAARSEFKLRSTLDQALPNAFVESFSVLKPMYDHSIVEVQTNFKRWVPKDQADQGLEFELETNTVVDKNGQTVLSIDPEQVDIPMADLTNADMVQMSFDVVKERVIKDGVTIYVIGGSRIYLPIWAPGNNPYEKFQQSPFIIQQTFPSVAQLEDEEKEGDVQNISYVKNDIFKKMKKDKRLGAKDSTSERIGLDLLLATKYQQTGYSNDFRIKRELAEVLEWHGKWDVKGVKREIICRIDRSSKTLLSTKINLDGVRPFFPIVPFPVDETPFGESLPKIIRTQVAELDLLINTVINIGLMKSMPPKFYDPAGGFNPQSMGNFGPNSWIPTREPAKNVYIPPQPEEPQVSFQMINLLIQIIERMTAINEVVQGEISKKANTTAFEVSQALNRSGVRFEMIYERIKEQMQPLFDYIYRLELRHMPFSKEVQIMGDQPTAENPHQSMRLVEIFRDQIKGHFSFEVSGGSVMNESLELQKAVTMFNTVGQHPYLSYKPESIYYMLFNIVKRLNPIAMTKILPTPAEVKEIERSRAQVQGEQQQLALAQQALQNQKANNDAHLTASESLRTQRRLGEETQGAPASQA